MGRVALYARISLDRKDGQGVERQIANCLELARARGWDDVIEYVDNDMSAYKKNRRPAWDQLNRDLAAGGIDVLIAQHPDRLYRRLTDLEILIESIEKHDVEVATVKAGRIDLSTATGRGQAGMAAVWAKMESERIGERVSDSKEWRASQGQHSGGGRRPFGLTSDRSGLVEEEAQVLRAVADALMRGHSWRSQVAALNDAGVTQTTGRFWTVTSLRKCLLSPHIAGLRSYKGEIVGEAAWPEVIDRTTWDYLRVMSPRTKGRPPSDRWLLSSLVVCGSCGWKMYACRTKRATNYRCSPNHVTTGRGCGKVSIAAHLVENHVEQMVLSWLNDPVAAKGINRFLSHGDRDPESSAARAEVEEIDRRLAVMAGKYGAGDLSDAEYEAGRDVLLARRAGAESRVVGRSRPVLAVSAGEIAGAWESMSVPERRLVVSGLAQTPIKIAPGRGPNGRVPVDERVSLKEAWA